MNMRMTVATEEAEMQSLHTDVLPSVVMYTWPPVRSSSRGGGQKLATELALLDQKQRNET